MGGGGGLYKIIEMASARSPKYSIYLSDVHGYGGYRVEANGVTRSLVEGNNQGGSSTEFHQVWHQTAWDQIYAAK